MVDSDRRRLLKYAIGGAIGGGLVTSLTDGDSGTQKRAGGSDAELESVSDTQGTDTVEDDSAEDSITVKDCVERREVERGEEDLECGNREERLDNITEEYRGEYGDRRNWPTKRR
jgi:hypothetical protein